MPKDGHSKGSKGKGGPKIWYTNWDCHVCGLEDNRGNRARCRGCGAYPKSSERRPLWGKGDKGGEGKGNGEQVVQWGNGPLATPLAIRQLQQQKHENRSLQQARELAEAKKLTEALREQNRKLQREISECANKVQTTASEDMDGLEGPGALTEVQRQEEIMLVTSGLPYLEKQFGKDSKEYTEAADKLERLRRAQRDAKPYKTHRAQLERRLEKLRRQQEADKHKLEETQTTITSLQQKSEDLKAEMSERSKEIEASDEELKELLRRAMAKGGEDDGEDAETVPDPATSWNTVVQAASSIASHPAIPQEWAQQLEGLFRQLQTAVATMEGAKQQYEQRDPKPTHAAAAATTTTVPAATAAATVTATTASTTQHAAQMQQQQQEQQQLQEQLAAQRSQQQQLQQQLQQQTPSPPAPSMSEITKSAATGTTSTANAGASQDDGKQGEGEGGGNASEDEFSSLASEGGGPSGMELDEATLDAMADLPEDKKRQLATSLQQKLQERWREASKRRRRKAGAARTSNKPKGDSQSRGTKKPTGVTKTD